MVEVIEARITQADIEAAFLQAAKDYQTQYDYEMDLRQAFATHREAAAKAVTDRLRDLPDDVLHIGLKAWRETIAFGDRAKLAGETNVIGFNALDAMRAAITALADALEKQHDH